MQVFEFYREVFASWAGAIIGTAVAVPIKTGVSVVSQFNYGSEMALLLEG
jgi:hypothetical protein